MDKNSANAFDRLADKWDQYRQLPSLTLPILLRYCNDNAEVVLDAGCGNGRNSIELAKHFARVAAFDSSKPMLEQAKKNVAEAALENIVLSVADVRQLPFDDASVDAIFSFAVLHHLKTSADRLKAFKEMRRCLRKGGRVLATVWNKDRPSFDSLKKDDFVGWTTEAGRVKRFYHFYDEEELRGLAAKAGFKVLAIFFEKKGEKVENSRGAKNLCFILEKP